VGDIVLHACIDRGQLEVGAGPLTAPDLIIETGPAIKSLMARELSPAAAIESGGVRLSGDAQRLTEFVEAFRI
jgi:hypothetical protein